MRSGTTWTQQQKFVPLVFDSGKFGHSVDIDGETIVVGKHLDDTAFHEAGNAHVFVRSGTTWTREQTLVASDAAADDKFGIAVAIDGESILISAVANDIGASDTGSAYVFTRSGTTWTEQQILTASDALAGDFFGGAVAIDSDTAVIGAMGRADVGTGSGTAYVFTRQGTTWTQQERLNASDAASGDQFGNSVDVVGDTVLIGVEQQDNIGSNSGSAFLFKRSGSTWSQLPKLTASDAESGDLFGSAVALSANFAVIGALLGDSSSVDDSGAVYIFGTALPAAPTSVTATAGNTKATVSWTAPTGSWNSTISSYTVTASPGGATANTSGTSVDVTGLANGTAYTFVVTATNPSGNSPASSASSGVTPIALVTAAGEVLTTIVVPTSLNLLTGQVVAISVSPRNENGTENLSMPSMVYSWIAGSCGTLSSTSTRTVVFTAISSGCDGTIAVHASQGGNTQIPASDHLITIKLTAPPAPLVVIPPFDPINVLPIIPVGLTADDVALILPSTGGTFTVPQDPSSTAAPVTLTVPIGALDNGTSAAVTINVIDTGNLQSPPPSSTEGASSGTFRFGSIVVEVQWFDDTGKALDTFKLNKPATLCVPYEKADIDGAAMGPDGLNIWRFNGTVWVKLNSSVNTSTGAVCAYTSNFSAFTLGLDVAAPEASDAPTGLPVTGGYTPNALTLMLAMFGGLALIGTGVVAIRRTRIARAVR